MGILIVFLFLFHNDVTFGYLNSLFCWLIAKEGEREREREDKIDAPTSILICLCVSMRDLSFCEVIKKLREKLLSFIRLVLDRKKREWCYS